MRPRRRGADEKRPVVLAAPPRGLAQVVVPPAYLGAEGGGEVGWQRVSRRGARLDSGVHAHRGSGRDSGARGRRGGVGAVRGAPGQGLTLLLKVMWLTHACVMAACSSVATSSDWLRSSS